MGLPSDNRWAVSNLDAKGPNFFQESPFQYECSFFSWGNVTPHNPISETTFDYNFGGSNSAAPYYEGQPYGETPGSSLTGDIPLNMDAARKMLGRPWRMPTSADFKELFDNCIYINADGTEVETTKRDKLVNVNGVLGLYLKSKTNGAQLFFPCSGSGQGQTWILRGEGGRFWSSRYRTNRYAWSMSFNSGGVNPQSYNHMRHFGLAIRPIWNPRDLRD